MGFSRTSCELLLLALSVVTANASLQSLRDAASARGLLIGAATNVAQLANASEPMYRTTEQAQFSITTAENSCKVGPVHPEPDRYNFEDCDAVFAAAGAAGQKVRGHNLCWHQQNPSWLNKSLSHDQLVAALEAHINTVVTHYGTKAYAWDVVNEAVSDGGQGQPVVKKVYDPWMPAVPDFIDRAFHAARAAGGPSVKLFYNDYGAEVLNAKSDRMYALVKGLIARKVPIDGVGFQTHISNSFYTQIPSMEANLKRFAALGLDIHITELDVRACSDSSTCDDNALARQGEVYEGLLRMCLRIASCKVFEMWGFTDKHTWTRTFHNPTRKDEMPLPFDSSYQAKPAFYSMLKALHGSAPVPPPSPTPSHHYITQTTTCKNAKPISGLLRVSSVRECEQHCDEDAACIAVDTNGAQCYTKGSCDGTAGDCEGWCSYKKAR